MKLGRCERWMLVHERPVRIVMISTLSGTFLVVGWSLLHSRHWISVVLNVGALLMQAFAWLLNLRWFLEPPAKRLDLAALVRDLERTYFIAEGDRPAILCRTCGMVSFDPMDVENHYCACCRRFHEEPK